MTAPDANASASNLDMFLEMEKLTIRSKIGILAVLGLCFACAVWFLCPPDPPVWRVRTAFRIGMSVTPSAVIEGSSNLQYAIERYASVVTLISTPVFRDNIAGTSEFETGSAALSKRLVFDTLRAHALNDFDIEIQFVAASASDCRAAYRTIAERIEQRHAALSDQNAKVMQAAISEYRERADQLAKWKDAELQPGYRASTDIEKTQSDLAFIWNETREHLRQLEAAQSVKTATRFPPEMQVYVEGPLTNNTVRLSALAGLAVILCTFVLLSALEIRASRRRNTDT